MESWERKFQSPCDRAGSHGDNNFLPRGESGTMIPAPSARGNRRKTVRCSVECLILYIW
jgi:hypothetical protein